MRRTVHFLQKNRARVRQLRIISHLLCVSFIATVPIHTYAGQTGSSVNYKFSGILSSSKPCVINNGLPIDVDFGTVYISKIASGVYKKTLKYTVSCDGASPDSVVHTSINGIPVDEAGTAIASDSEGLWVRFLNNGTPVKLNSRQKVSSLTRLPVFQVQLIKNPDKDLHESEFSAAAMLLFDYQ